MPRKLLSHDLQGDYSFEVLVALLQYGEMNKQILYAGISNSTGTLGRRVNDLERIGLVVVDRNNKYNVHNVSLTEKGRRAAQKIMELEEVLKEP